MAILEQHVRFSMMAINAWLSFRLTVGIGVTLMTVTTLIAVIEHEYAHADSAQIGLAPRLGLNKLSFLVQSEIKLGNFELRNFCLIKQKGHFFIFCEI